MISYCLTYLLATVPMLMKNPDLAGEDNERLEFLGDAVLQLCMSDILIRRFPDYAEGQLQR